MLKKAYLNRRIFFNCKGSFLIVEDINLGVAAADKKRRSSKKAIKSNSKGRRYRLCKELSYNICTYLQLQKIKNKEKSFKKSFNKD